MTQEKMRIRVGKKKSKQSNTEKKTLEATKPFSIIVDVLGKSMMFLGFAGFSAHISSLKESDETPFDGAWRLYLASKKPLSEWQQKEIKGIKNDTIVMEAVYTYKNIEYKSTIESKFEIMGDNSILLMVETVNGSKDIEEVLNYLAPFIIIEEAPRGKVK